MVDPSPNIEHKVAELERCVFSLIATNRALAARVEALEVEQNTRDDRLQKDVRQLETTLQAEKLNQLRTVSNFQMITSRVSSRHEIIANWANTVDDSLAKLFSLHTSTEITTAKLEAVNTEIHALRRKIGVLEADTK